MSRRSRVRWLLMVAVSLLFVLPLVFMVTGSLRTLGQAPPRTPELIPSPLAFENYGLAFDLVDIPHQIRNSLIVVLIAVPVTLLVASLAGFGMARSRPRTQGALVAFSFVALMVPSTALIVSRLAMFRSFGVTDTFIPLVAPSLMGTSPFYVLLFYWSFRRIPVELYEAAELEGARPLAMWWRVAMPLVRPMTVAVGALAAVVTWSNFLDPLVYLTDADLFTVPLGLKQLSQLDRVNYPLFLAGAVAATAPVLLAFVAVQRYFLGEHRRTGWLGEVSGAASVRGVVAVVVTLLLALSSGCGRSNSSGSPDPSSAGSASSSGAPTTVKFLTFGAPEELKAYRDVIAAFEKSQPSIKVELVEAADQKDLLTRLSTSFSAGNPPDLFLINYRQFGQFASKGAIDPVGPRVAASGVFNEADFYTEAIDAFRFRDQLTCLPQNISSLVVYYNKALFDAAGVSYPTAGWTWAQMVDMAAEMTLDTDGDGTLDQFGLGIDAQLIRVAPFVWSNGGTIVDDTAKPTQLTLGTPAATEVLEDFLDLYRVDEVIPSEEEKESEDINARFQSGKMAMVFGSRRQTPEFRSVDDLDFDIASLPVYKTPANILHSDAYCLSAASAKKDAAWRFVEYAVGPVGAPIVAASGRTVPSLRSVASSPAFLDPSARPASAQIFLDNIVLMQRVPTISTWPEIETATSKILEDALYEGGNATEVAEELNLATTSMFARAEQ